MDEVVFRCGGGELLESIRGLWEDLNRLHMERSKHFKEHYSRYSFDERRPELLSKSSEGLRVDVTYCNDRAIAYCVSSISGQMGEIDSIYVTPEFRRMGIGEALIRRSIGWLHGNQVSNIRVSISFGNDEAAHFYRKYGFLPRLTVMEKK